MFLAIKDNIFLTGYSNEKIKGDKVEQGNFDAMVAKFDTDGNNKWVQKFGSKSKLDYGTDLSVADPDKLYVTGFTDGFLGSNSSGSNGAGVDAWLAQLDTEKGKLQKFIGSSLDVASIENPGAVPVEDISNQIVTDEKLPSGDNRINPAAGIDLPSGSSSTLNYGKFESSLGGIFDPDAENSFPSALAESIGDDFPY